MSFRHELALAASAAAVMAPMAAPEAVDARAVDSTTIRLSDTGSPEGPHATFQDCARASFDSVLKDYPETGPGPGRKTGKYILKLNLAPVEVPNPTDELAEPSYCDGDRKVTTNVKVSKKLVKRVVAIGNSSLESEHTGTFPRKYVSGRICVSAVTTVSYTEDGVTSRRKLPANEMMLYKDGKIEGVAFSCSKKDIGAEPPITEG